MPAVLHARAEAPTGTKLTDEANVVPEAGSFAVAPVAVAAVVHVGERDSLHKRAVFQQPCLGVLYKPDARVEVVDYLPAPKNEGVGESEVSKRFRAAAGAGVLGAAGASPDNVEVPWGKDRVVPS